MALAKIKSYQYTPTKNQASAQFAVEKVQLETSCRNYQSHRSEAYKIFFVEEGSGKYQIDFQDIEITGSGIFFLSPGQALQVLEEHLSRATQISFNREFYCIETHGKEIACNGVLFNNMHKGTYLNLDESTGVLFKGFIQKLVDELENPGRAHREMLETYLRLILIEALRLNEIEHSAMAVSSEQESRMVGDFIALVDKNFRSIHSVSAYAEQLFISPKSLAKRLKLEGYPRATEIIRDRIVLEAKRDLRYTQKSIKEIAIDLGFEDPGYFTRLFKKAETNSPQNYRLSFLNQQ